MPVWLVNFLLKQVIPLVVSFIESELPNLEAEGIAALAAKFPGLVPLLQALGLMPKS